MDLGGGVSQVRQRGGRRLVEWKGNAPVKDQTQAQNGNPTADSEPGLSTPASTLERARTVYLTQVPCDLSLLISEHM